MKLRLGTSLFSIGVVAVVFTSCGQAPSFLNRDESSGLGASSQGESLDAGAAGVPVTDVNGDGVIDAADMIPGDGTTEDASGIISNPETEAPSESGTGGSGAGSTTAGGTTPPAAVYPTVPGATPDDLDVLHKCMDKWKTLPWNGTVPNFRKIYASVNIGGLGTTINETQRTAEPELVIIYAGVNVGGATQWNLMNPNGYYCMAVNVNVQTQFAINLHCNARLADNSIQVNVGGTTSNATSAVGVNVLSTVNVNSISPVGDACVR